MVGLFCRGAQLNLLIFLKYSIHHPFTSISLHRTFLIVFIRFLFRSAKYSEISNLYLLFIFFLFQNTCAKYVCSINFRCAVFTILNWRVQMVYVSNKCVRARVCVCFQNRISIIIAKSIIFSINTKSHNGKYLKFTENPTLKLVCSLLSLPLFLFSNAPVHLVRVYERDSILNGIFWKIFFAIIFCTINHLVNYSFRYIP